MTLFAGPKTMIDPQDAAQERARRERARRHLVAFSEYVAPHYRAARHHRLVAEYLEQVETYIRTQGRTGVGRLLIFEPPRHGKSEQASKLFPAWVLGRNPDARVMTTSYGLDLATKFSRGTRDIVDGPRYAALFGEQGTTETPVELASDSRSVQSWDLAQPHRGGMTAAGVGGAITGMGAHLLIVDDPIKNRDEAESETIRERIWEWWTSTAYTRLEQGGAVVGMMTRWHPDDWAGRLLKLMGSGLGDRWVVLNLPAIAEDFSSPTSTTPTHGEQREAAEYLLEGLPVPEADLLGRAPGEALWPEKYDRGDLEQIKTNVGPYNWEALYQQRPYSRAGGFFRRDWFGVVDAAPELTRRVRYWDKAGSVGGDYSAGVLLAMGRDGNYYIEHVSTGQWTPHERERIMREIGLSDLSRPGPSVQTWHFQDPGSAGLDSAQQTSRNLAGAGITAHYETVSGDKEVRAGPLSGMAQAGFVRLVRGGWNQAFIDELAAFPKGAHDDQVDAAAGAFNKLLASVPAEKLVDFV